MPDDWTRAMRRRLAYRAQLVRARTRAKNEIHAVLIRRLKGRPPMTDVFGVRGRRWLADWTVLGLLEAMDLPLVYWSRRLSRPSWNFVVAVG